MMTTDRIRRGTRGLGAFLAAGILVCGPLNADDDAGVKKYDPAAVTGEVAKGGYLLILQHAATGEPEAAGECGDTLSAAERAVAESIGAGFQAKGVPVSRILSSERCAAVETARSLGLGDVEVSADLNPVDVDTTDADEVGRLKNMLAVPTTAGTNVLLVSHRDNVNRLLKIDVDSAPGTLHALRKGDGSVAYTGTVAPGDWPTGSN